MCPNGSPTLHELLFRTLYKFFFFFQSNPLIFSALFPGYNILAPEDTLNQRLLFLRPSLTDTGDPWLDALARSLTSCSTLPFAPVPRSPSGLLPACPRLTGDSDITP